MVSSQFSIAFDFAADQGHLAIRLNAEVATHHSQLYYVVTKFRVAGHERPPVLPDIRIKGHRGRWVHTDSEKGTELSEAVGRVIDLHERAVR